jgi:hypothetical protein
MRTVLAKHVVCNRAQSTAMNRELKCPQWQEPFYDALLEFNPVRLRLKLQKAEEAIATRKSAVTHCSFACAR